MQVQKIHRFKHFLKNVISFKWIVKCSLVDQSHIGTLGNEKVDTYKQKHLLHLIKRILRLAFPISNHLSKNISWISGKKVELNNEVGKIGTDQGTC